LVALALVLLHVRREVRGLDDLRVAAGPARRRRGRRGDARRLARRDRAFARDALARRDDGLLRDGARPGRGDRLRGRRDGDRLAALGALDALARVLLLHLVRLAARARELDRTFGHGEGASGREPPDRIIGA